MKILLANKFYYNRGGDCVVTMNLERLLKEKGHEVAVFAMDYPENLPSEWSKYFPSEVKFSPGIGMVEAFLRPFGTSEVKKKFAALLEDFRPDVVHLHNIHTQLSPVIAELAHEKGIRVVWTLHDSKLSCPCYTCQRNGKWCEECFTNKWAVVKHRCMPGSIPGAIIGSLELQKWNASRLQSCTDYFLPPSQFMKDIAVKSGYSEEKFKVLCNFIDIDKVKSPSFEKEDYYIFLGRVTEVKGIRTLCKATERIPYKLKVIGDGELLPELKREYGEKVEFLGQMEWNDFRPILEKAKFMVLPAECSENNPLSVIEAQCLGTPVLGARIGGIPELINEGISGMCFESGNVNELKEKIEAMWGMSFNYESIAKNAVEQYSSEKYYEKLIQIYTGQN